MPVWLLVALLILYFKPSLTLFEHVYTVSLSEIYLLQNDRLYKEAKLSQRKLNDKISLYVALKFYQCLTGVNVNSESARQQE